MSARKISEEPVMQTVATKVCGRCAQEKDRAEFHRERARKDGLHGWCKACQREWVLARRKPATPNEALPDGVKRCSVCKEVKADSAYYAAGKIRSPDGLLAQCKTCCAVLRRKTYYAKREYYVAKSVEWTRGDRARNPEQHRRHSRHRNWRERGMTPEQIAYADTLTPLPCSWCGKQPCNGIDHVVPEYHGGTHDPSNLAPCCKWCNIAKAKKSVEEFAHELFMAATIG